MKEKRQKTKCPVKGCNVARYNLPRHMRKIHQWSDNEAKNVKSLYGLRKEYRFHCKDKSVQKVSHFHKHCPIYGCRSVVINMSQHLQKLHKMSRFSSDYKKLLKQAVTADVRSSKHWSNSTGTIEKQAASKLLDPCSKLESENDSDLSYHPADSSSSSCMDQSSLSNSQSSSANSVEDSTDSVNFEDCSEEDETSTRKNVAENRNKNDCMMISQKNISKCADDDAELANISFEDCLTDEENFAKNVAEYKSSASLNKTDCTVIPLTKKVQNGINRDCPIKKTNFENKSCEVEVEASPLEISPIKKVVNYQNLKNVKENNGTDNAIHCVNQKEDNCISIDKSTTQTLQNEIGNQCKQLKTASPKIINTAMNHVAVDKIYRILNLKAQ